jgi:GT2 family glycosyltransferase
VHPVSISAIIPTIGRPESLRNLLQSLCIQTVKVDEVVVADGSSTGETEAVVNDPRWKAEDLLVRHVRVQPPNAVRQREAAISRAGGELLLLLDDDVVLEPDCVEQMLRALAAGPEVVAVTANFENESWSRPTKSWRWYLRYVHGLKEDEWQGRILGPLLRFGYYTPQSSAQTIEWLGTGNSLIRRSAFDLAGGFSDFFLHRCTMNEDVDLGLKLSRVGRILFCPTARLSHFHAPGGRLSALEIAEDDLHNRFQILHRTVGNSKTKALSLVTLYYLVETAVDLLGAIRRRAFSLRLERISGRSHAMFLIASNLVFKRES